MDGKCFDDDCPTSLDSCPDPYSTNVREDSDELQLPQHSPVFSADKNAGRDPNHYIYST